MSMTSIQKAKLLKIAPNSLGMFMFMQKFEAEYKQKVQNLEEMFDQKLRELAEKMAIQREEHMKGMEELIIEIFGYLLVLGIAFFVLALLFSGFCTLFTCGTSGANIGIAPSW